MKHASRKKDDAAITVDLECSQCHTHRSTELSAEKFKELSAAWKLTQECDVCRQATDWSFAEASVEAEEQLDFWDWLATTGETFMSSEAGPQHERRKESRVDLRVLLRVATASGEEEEVTSENISRSGFCFASSKAYSIGESLRVTLHPAGSVTPQTKTAILVRASALQEGKTLYGVRLAT